MRHILFAIAILGAVLLSTALPTAAKSKEKNPRIEFTTQTHDFGKISSKDKATVEFIFTNTGDGNLVITQANSECGCTRPEYPDYPIAPGKEGVIKVTYSPRGHIGHFEKSVTVRTNGEPRKIKLKIKGEVEK